MREFPTPWGPVREVRQPHDLHSMGCPCLDCQIYHPGDERPFGWREIGWRCLAGVVVGNAIAFAVDPHGSARALAACFGWAL